MSEQNTKPNQFSNGNTQSMWSKLDNKKENDIILSILEKNNMEELSRFFLSKNETFQKFELNEENLNKLRQLRKFFFYY